MRTRRIHRCIPFWLASECGEQSAGRDSRIRLRSPDRSLHFNLPKAPGRLLVSRPPVASCDSDRSPPCTAGRTAQAKVPEIDYRALLVCAPGRWPLGESQGEAQADGSGEQQGNGCSLDQAQLERQAGGGLDGRGRTAD